MRVIPSRFLMSVVLIGLDAEDLKKGNFQFMQCMYSITFVGSDWLLENILVIDFSNTPYHHWKYSRSYRGVRFSIWALPSILRCGLPFCIPILHGFHQLVQKLFIVTAHTLIQSGLELVPDARVLASVPERRRHLYRPASIVDRDLVSISRDDRQDGIFVQGDSVLDEILIPEIPQLASWIGAVVVVSQLRSGLPGINNLPQILRIDDDDPEVRGAPAG
jgi:hypothetical protein